MPPDPASYDVEWFIWAFASCGSFFVHCGDRLSSIFFVDVMRFVGGKVADNVNSTAGLALFEMMMIYEDFPMRPLMGHYYAGPLAQGTNAFQGRDHCRPNELGPVGNPLHRLSKRFGHLERYDVEFFSFHGSVVSGTQRW
jgi:hypothetical protein